MIIYPDIDPIALSLGPLDVRWYGLTYLAAFAVAWWLGNRRADGEGSGWSRDDVADLVFYGALGVVLGGRIGYVFFYSWDRFVDDPLYLFAIREGGMSFHGGLIGVSVEAHSDDAKEPRDQPRVARVGGGGCFAWCGPACGAGPLAP